MIEDFTYSEIEDIIKKNYFDVKEEVEQLAMAQKEDMYEDDPISYGNFEYYTSWIEY